MKTWIYIPAIIVSLFLAVPAHATVSVLGADSLGQGNVSTITLNTTMPVGENTLMIAIFHLELGQSVTTPNPTWNTTETFTLASVIDASPEDNTEIWYLVGPTQGTFDFVGNITDSNNHMVGLIFLEGVDGSDPIGATPAGVFSVGTTDSVTITTTAANSMIVDGASWGDNNSVLTEGGSQTEQYEVGGTGGGPSFSKVQGAASTRLVTTAQQYINTYTSTISVNYSYLGIEVKEMVDAGGEHQDQVTAGVHQDVVTGGVHQDVVNGL